MWSLVLQNSDDLGTPVGRTRKEHYTQIEESTSGENKEVALLQEEEACLETEDVQEEGESIQSSNTSTIPKGS